MTHSWGIKAFDSSSWLQGLLVVYFVQITYSKQQQHSRCGCQLPFISPYLVYQTLIVHGHHHHPRPGTKQTFDLYVYILLNYSTLDDVVQQKHMVSNCNGFVSFHLPGKAVALRLVVPQEGDLAVDHVHAGFAHLRLQRHHIT